ncbi:MAG: hypothetical protein ABEJ58_01650 [Halodesulfurarchaeum sp.]
MKIRDWQDVVSDVVESNADPDGWRAIAGKRRGGVGEDFYIGHPAAGLFLMKTYAKNPYDVKGVGTQVARKVDGDIESVLPDREQGRFAVQQPPESEDDMKQKAKRLESVLEAHADAPTNPGDLFDDMMETLESPAYGPIQYDNHDRSEELDELSTTFEDAEEALNAEVDDLVEEDDIGRGFQ